MKAAIGPMIEKAILFFQMKKWTNYTGTQGILRKDSLAFCMLMGIK
jgi:hypothetical protein